MFALGLTCAQSSRKITSADVFLHALLSAVIKLAIGGIFPEGSYGYLLMRTVRYALILFVLIGVYPFAFRLEKKRSDMALSSSARRPR